MAKKTKDELKAALTAAKEERKAAKEELRAFEKENSLPKGEDSSAHEKFGKKWTKLNEAYGKKVTKADAAEAALKELKAEKTERASKYEYPAEITSASDKKKFRASQRAAAKKAAKGEAAPAAEGGEKKRGTLQTLGKMGTILST